MSKRYFVSDIAELDWEICRRDRTGVYVVATVRKTSDDDNCYEAERKCAKMNARTRPVAPRRKVGPR